MLLGLQFLSSLEYEWSFAVDATVELLRPNEECDDLECIAGAEFEEERKRIPANPAEKGGVLETEKLTVQQFQKRDDEV